MTLFVISGETVTARSALPMSIGPVELMIRSPEEFEASKLTMAQLVRIWNTLPGATPVTKFRDRKAAIRRIWAAFQELPVHEDAPAHDPAPSGSTSKQAQVIDLLKRPEGATVGEIMSVTGWQPHTVRGLFSGALRKRLGLTILSGTEEHGRVYRIAAAA